MPRPSGSRNKRPYPKTRHKNFYWDVVSDEYANELAAFKRAHDRVRDGKSPSIHWPRSLDGFVGFLAEVGMIPEALEKPSLGRIQHAFGYEPGNVAWEEHALNSIKRKGTRHAC